MKIRIKGNSLRYRLTRSDIDSLAESGQLEEQTDFPGQSLVYALKTTEQPLMSAVFVDCQITLFLPLTMVTEMIHTEKVGFQQISEGLQLLVEKDFTCLDNVEEDQSDNYPNPLALNIK